jgi:hypothetical protein
MQLWTNFAGTDQLGNSDGHQIGGHNGDWKSGFAQFGNYGEPNFPNDSDYGTAPTCYKVTGNALASGPCNIGARYQGMPTLLTQQNTSIGITGDPFDHHGANRSQNTNDLYPVMYFNTAVPAQGRLAGSGYPNNAVAYGEIIGMATQTVPGCATSAVANFCEWRFSHNWNPGTTPDFYGGNNLGMNSQDGQFATFATPVMGTRGSTSPDWTTGAKPYGYLINPIVIYPTVANANHSSFRQDNPSGCTPGGTEPTSWPQTSADTQSDGTCTWTNVSQAAIDSTGQLPCNGLRADYLQAVGTAIYLGTRFFDLSATNIYQATGCLAASPCSSANSGAGLVAPGGGAAVLEGALTLSGSPAFHATVTDTASGAALGGITYQYIGQNDCRVDILLLSLTSAHQ